MKKQIFTIIFLCMGGVSTFGQFKFNSGTSSLRLQTGGVDRLTIFSGGSISINESVGITKNLSVDGTLYLERNNTPVVGIQNALDRDGKSVVFLSSGETVTVNGIAGGSDGMILYLMNGVDNTLILNHNSNAASTFDKITTNTGSPITITGSGGVTLIYFLPYGWRVIGFAQ